MKLTNGSLLLQFESGTVKLTEAETDQFLIKLSQFYFDLIRSRVYKGWAYERKLYTLTKDKEDIIIVVDGTHGRLPLTEVGEFLKSL